MFTDKRLRFLAALATASLVFVVASMAWAQVAPPASAPAEAPASESAATGPAPTVSVESLAGRWGEFFHYILLGQADAARSYGEAMIDMSPKPEEVYQLSVGAPNTQKNLDRAITLSPALKPVVEKLRAAKSYDKVL